MKNKVLNFELDSKDIKLKKLLEGDFLRLEAYTISDAKPNRNGSHFTKEAMEQAIPSFFDKPVLAYYNPALGEEGDFMGHECPNGLQYDELIDSLYYDYDAPQSEIPIGTVRQSDTVELVEKDGLNWIKVTCVLWTKYNYKAVRSLLRSRKGKTKLSVEIEVLSSHEENGIEIIDEFQLDGFTLLGRDRRGNEIEEGIAGAHAIAVDFLNENFIKHQQCLAFAYSALDNYTNQQNVETPNEVQALEKDSNIDFEKKENPVDNEEIPQVSMEEKVNQEEGGISAMQLTMQAKVDLLRVALEKALYGDEKENCCCYVWVMDICDKFVYYEFGDEKFRCPYMITELGEEHEVMLDLSAQERVVPSWSVFSAGEMENEGEKESFEHDDDGEGHKCIECAIRDLIIDEEEAIQGYSHAEKHFEEEYPLIAKIFHEIKEEEEVHIGELQQCLQMVNDESQEHIEEGIQEAKDIVVEEILEEQGEEGEESEGENPEGGMEKIFAEEGKEEDPEHKDKEEDPEEEEPENVEAPEDNKDIKKEEESCGNKEGESCESFEDDIDDKDDDEDDKDDEDDDKDDDDDNHEPDDDKDDKEDDFGCGKESEFSTTLDPNAEPLNVDVDGQTMSQILEDATASIKAPEVITNVEEMGAANAEVAKELDNVEEVVLEGDPDGTANEDGSPINPETVVKQPDDSQKERDKQFVSDVDASNVNVEELLKKYNELEEKFNQLNNAAKMQEAEKLIQFGKDFINADEVVDEETKQNYIAQVEEKCKAFEFASEEEVTKFAKGLMAMYYYEHQAVRKENNSSEEFSLALNKPTRVNNSASNKLKDAINKLNYLNKEE